MDNSDKKTDPNQAILDEVMPRVKEIIKEQAARSIAESLKYSISVAVGKEVTKYIDEVIAPQVRIELDSRKLEMTATIIAGVELGVLALKDAISKKIMEKLSKPYALDKVLNEVLGRGY